jgi:MFS family permease
MTKQDPTTPYTKSPDEPDSPLPKHSTLWHGLGLFGESYLLFSIGTLKPFWTLLYPACFDESDLSECANPYLSYKSITYSVVSGVMLGMVLLGILANSVGRRRGSILTAGLMTIGAVSMTLSSVFLSSVPSVLFPVMSLSLFVFGIGVGGEYPLSASSASERAMADMKRRREQESDHEEKIKRLLEDHNNHNSSEGNATKSWQTLQTTVQVKFNEVDAPPAIPLSTTNVTGRSRNSLNSQNVRLRARGKEVLMVFSMQGAGIFTNSLLLTFLLMITKRKGEDNNANEEAAGVMEYDQFTLLNIWRATYATGTMILVYVLISRIIHLTESEVWAQDREQRKEHITTRDATFVPPKVGPETNNNEIDDTKILPSMSQITLGSQFDGLGSTNLDGCRVVPTVIESMNHGDDAKPSKVSLLFQHYGVRLFGASLTWLLWDIAFYGNKLFQSSFFLVLTGEDAALMDITGASAINAFVALLGYYVAASIVDDPDVGRLTLQQVGFIITGTLFLLCGCLSDRLSSTWLVIIYFGSSIFGQVSLMQP